MGRFGRATYVRRRLWWLGLAAAIAACGFPLQRSGLPGLTCVRVPDDTCVSYAQSLGLGTDPTVVAVQLECTRAACSGASGEVRVLVRRADGRVEESGFGWQEAAPRPVPPVPAPVPRPVPVPVPSAGSS